MLATFGDLPLELVGMIVKLLDTQSILYLRLTCVSLFEHTMDVFAKTTFAKPEWQKQMLSRRTLEDLERIANNPKYRKHVQSLDFDLRFTEFLVHWQEAVVQEKIRPRTINSITNGARNSRLELLMLALSLKRMGFDSSTSAMQRQMSISNASPTITSKEELMQSGPAEEVMVTKRPPNKHGVFSGFVVERVRTIPADKRVTMQRPPTKREALFEFVQEELHFWGNSESRERLVQVFKLFPNLKTVLTTSTIEIGPNLTNSRRFRQLEDIEKRFSLGKYVRPLLENRQTIWTPHLLGRVHHLIATLNRACIFLDHLAIPAMELHLGHPDFVSITRLDLHDVARLGKGSSEAYLNRVFRFAWRLRSVTIAARCDALAQCSVLCLQRIRWPASLRHLTLMYFNLNWHLSFLENLPSALEKLSLCWVQIMSSHHPHGIATTRFFDELERHLGTRRPAVDFGPLWICSARRHYFVFCVPGGLPLLEGISHERPELEPRSRSQGVKLYAQEAYAGNQLPMYFASLRSRPAVLPF